jgi:hypothetical protein
MIDLQVGGAGDMTPDDFLHVKLCTMIKDNQAEVKWAIPGYTPSNVLTLNGYAH